MEIQGFYYDKQRKKYFRIESGNSGRNQLTKADLKQRIALESIHSYNRLDRSIHLPKALHRQEIDCQTEYNLREELIRSQLKSLKTCKSTELEVIDFCGNQMQDISVQSLIGSPKSDQLFAVLTGSTGAVVYQISVEDVFSDDYDPNASKRMINSFSKPNKVIDVSFISGSNGCDSVSTLVHHFPTADTINTSFTLNAVSGGYDWPNPLRQVYEFSEPIFSGTHFEDMNILGAEKQIYVFKPSYSGNIQIIRFEDNVTALKIGSDGKLFITGTNKGQLSCFDIRENNNLCRRSALSVHNKSITHLHILNDGYSVMSSAHNHYLSLSDLRMFVKPVLQYCSHSNDCSKIPFSVDESADLLCSSGDDNLVRFWSIKSAKLLHMYCPALTDNSDLQKQNCLPSVQPLSHVSYSNSWKCLNNRFKPLLFSMAANQLNVCTFDP